MRTLTNTEKKMVEAINGTLTNRKDYFEAVANIMNGNNKATNSYATAKNEIFLEDGTGINLYVRKNVIKEMRFWNRETGEMEWVKF